MEPKAPPFGPCVQPEIGDEEIAEVVERLRSDWVAPPVACSDALAPDAVHTVQGAVAAAQVPVGVGRKPRV